MHQKSTNSTNGPLILVTGATGKTGGAVLRQLLEGGHRVRALVRARDERADALAALGAEIVVGDVHDLASMRGGVEGAQRAYFCYPPQGDHLVEATAIFAIAARDAGVTTVVNMSQITAREDAPSRLSRQHWQGERVLDWAGVGAVHVNPTFFSENLFMFGAQTIATEGKLYLPYGDELHAPVSAADIARVVVAILVRPAGHEGKRYVLTGPELLTLPQMADELARGLGVPVEYVEPPVDAWAGLLTGVPGMSPSLVKHLVAVAGDHREGVFHAQNDLVEAITGRPAQPLAEVIEEVKAAYGFEETVAAV